MVEIYLDILNRLGVDHECNGQTDRQTAIVRSNDVTRASKTKHKT